MKVVICLEFPDVTDVDSQEATDIVESLTAETPHLQAQWHAAAVWVDAVEPTPL